MSIAMTWAPAPRVPQLQTDEVHVWSVLLAVGDELTKQLSEHLSPNELERASRYLADQHRRRFIVSRARQREILARYLNASPVRLRFRYEPLGKPVLDTPFRNNRLRFNLSNSGDVALLAVGLDEELGVDVERVRDFSNLEPFSERYFSQQECAVLHSQSSAERLAAFFHCWTRKEAILKATGKGLTSPLDQVIVSIAPGEPSRVLSIDGDSDKAAEWWLAALAPVAGYVGAVARRSAAPWLRCWQFAD